MELAPQAYETAVSDPGVAFVLEAAGVEQEDPAPSITPSSFDSKL